MLLCRYGCSMIERIISGGQTGADQAGLAVAKRLGVATGGCMPKGWLTEAGPRPDLGATYGLEEAETAAYPERTERNVLAADGTVVFGDARSRGSMLTARLCRRHGKPCLMVPLDSDPITPPICSAHGLPSMASGHSTSPAIAPAKRRASRRS